MNATTIDRSELEHRPWHPFDHVDGVREKVLWGDPSSRGRAGILSLEPGAHIPTHVHARAMHHVLVLSGACLTETEGPPLETGSYAHVPSGEPHSLRDAGGGSSVFYLYLPDR